MNIKNSAITLKDFAQSADNVNKVKQLRRLEELKGSTLSEEDRLQRTCEEFEAILIKQWMTAMRKTVPEGGLFENGHADKMYEFMHDDALSREIAHGKGMGLSEVLFRQLSGQNTVTTGR